MITPEMAWYWAFFKALGGQTYAGSVGWQRYVTFLEDRMDAFGLIDKYYIDIPYDHYIVDDWPDPRTHMAYFDGVLEKLVSDGTPVPVVASYGMTSGSTPSTGITAPMIYYDPANPPTDIALKR